ncbi:uroporphyrinogen decarboxylase [Mesoterricola silvestris]|uniref:Uroporphyrinogen decarboxylase n=1 Tax=Mesoterricola silvestris TaxID=2927979 RepID=A0AA48H0W8_9BACT|nr:uroporphyrinogen decarboxylase [Mesoterricola silvestris]BDU73993.1 uroporphyrinogen decarboxylase [Mesoterricola silvestris]
MTPQLVRALRGEVLPTPPIWFMRQAGRFLPEYRRIREKASFEDLLYDSDLAAEVTLQPVRRFPKLDGAIIFSDILVILEALGCGVVIPEGGPRLTRTLDQVDPDVLLDEKVFESVQAALRKVRAALPEDKALLGFAGAPWTLLAYGLEGKGSKNWVRAKSFLHQEPAKARLWLDRLADASARLLNLHIGAGAQGVQLFDTWAGELDREDYETFALPAAHRALAQVEGAPRLYFPRGILPSSLGTLPCEGFAVSWQVPMAQARAQFPGKVLQGNLDPTALLAGEETAVRKAKAIVQVMKGAPHVFNLGHGLLPETDPAVVGAVIDAVKG